MKIIKLIVAAIAVLLFAVCVRGYTCSKVSGDCTVGTPVYSDDTGSNDKLVVNLTGDSSDADGICIAWCTVNRTVGNFTYENFSGDWGDTSTWNYTYSCNHGFNSPDSLSAGLWRHTGTNKSIIIYGTVANGGCNYSVYGYLNGTEDREHTLVGKSTGGKSPYPPWKPATYIAVGFAVQMLIWWRLRRSR